MKPDQLEADCVTDQVGKRVEKGRVARKKAKEPRVAAKKAAASKPRNETLRSYGILIYQ